MLIDFRAQILPGVDDACPTHLVSTAFPLRSLPDRKSVV